MSFQKPILSTSKISPDSSYGEGEQPNSLEAGSLGVIILPRVWKLSGSEKTVKSKNGVNIKIYTYSFSIIGVIELDITLSASLTPPSADLEVAVKILGNSVGDPFKFDISKEGAIISVDAFLIKGYLKFFLKDNYLQLEYDLKAFGLSNFRDVVPLFQM